MKNIYNKAAYACTLLAATAFLSACEKDDHTGYSTLNPTSPNVSVTNLLETTTFAEEEEAEVQLVTITLSEPQIVGVTVYIEQVGGDAVWGEDFDVPSQVTIPAGSTTATIPLAIIGDCEIEGTESVQLQIGNNATANANVTPVNVSFDIVNYASTALTFDVRWAGASPVYDISGAEVGGAALADYDILIYYFDGTSYSLYDYGATGSFEHFDVEFADAPDGMYLIEAQLYAAKDLGEDGPVAVPVVTNISRCGVFGDQTLEQSPEMVLNTGNADEDGGDESWTSLGVIEKNGDTFTIYNDAETVIFEGKALDRDQLGSIRTVAKK